MFPLFKYIRVGLGTILLQFIFEQNAISNSIAIYYKNAINIAIYFSVKTIIAIFIKKVQ